MAKRKTPARGKGGRFIKGGGSSRSSGPTAIVVAAPRAPVRRRSAAVTRRAAAPARRRRRGGGSHGGGSFVGSLKRQVRPLMASAAYGWVTNGDSGTTAGKIKSYLDKVPVLDSIGKPASHGLLATFVAVNTRGMTRQIFDLVGQAALMRAAYNFGSAGFSLEAGAKLAGIEDGDDLSGSMGYDDMGDDLGDDDES